MYNYLINTEELTLMSAYHVGGGWCLFIKMVAVYLLVADKTYLVLFHANWSEKYLPKRVQTL